MINAGAGPRHVAFIMDGNRRWARSKGYEDVSTGHEFGSVRGEQVLEWCRAAHIRHVTVYVASLDNIRKRSTDEVRKLMDLVERFVRARLTQRDCQLHVAGQIDQLPDETAAVLRHACEVSRGFDTDYHLTAAIAYDGHTEILDAVRGWLARKVGGGKSLEELALTLSVDDIAANLYTKGQPCPELVIRTGGDFRLSCFMPWQTAYSRLYFSKAYWPALTKAEFGRALRWCDVPSLGRGSATKWFGAMGARHWPEVAHSVLEAAPSARRQRARTGQSPRHLAFVLASNSAREIRDGGSYPAKAGVSFANVCELLSWCEEFEVDTVTFGLLAADEITHAAPMVKRRLHELVASIEDLSNSPLKPRLRLRGMLSLLPEYVLSQLTALVARTRENRGPKTNLAICYDGRSEIVEAVRKLLVEHASLGRSLDDFRDRLGTDDIARSLCEDGDPDLDLIIVLSRSQILNGFLSWEAVRSEFWFWNRDLAKFRKKDFQNALTEYASRSRRFGA